VGAGPSPVRLTAGVNGRRCAQGARQDAIGADAGHVHRSPPVLAADPRGIRIARPASRLGGFSSTTSGADAGQQRSGAREAAESPHDSQARSG